MGQSRRKVQASTRRKPALLDALGARYDIVTTQETTMLLPPFVALDCIQRGDGNRPQVEALSQFINFSAFLCEKGWRKSALPAAQAGQQAISRMMAHLADIEWRRVAALEQTAYASVCRCLSVLASQIESATPNQIVRAHTEYCAWLAEPQQVKPPEAVSTVGQRSEATRLLGAC